MRRKELIMMMVTVIAFTLIMHFIRGREIGIAELLGTIAGAALGTTIVAFIIVLLSKRRSKQVA